ncbi:LCP family protein [Actinophytocola sp.]|uniref:LCP family protein n=1 Tax=Actinophytocola sp. TaxID=1872138 RepID=UPI002ED96802
MTADRTESLIREAFAAEADRAPDPRTVLAELARARPPRRRGMALVAAAVVVAVVTVAAVVMPKVLDRGAPPPAGGTGPAPAQDQNVLLVGLDTLKLADAIMLAHVDADGSATVLSLPRDTWVAVPGHGSQRLNAVYAEGGIDRLLDTVRGLTGVRPEHYAMVDMARFADVASAIGGVEVCLRRPTTDRLANVSFPAGPQVLSGSTALAFLRQRHGLDEGDLDRMVRQQAFLRSVIRKLRESPDTLGPVLDVVRGRATLDPGWDLLGLAEQLRASGSGQLTFGTIPLVEIDYRAPNGASAIRVDPAAVRTYVEARFGPGHPATGPQEPRGTERPCVD